MDQWFASFAPSGRKLAAGRATVTVTDLDTGATLATIPEAGVRAGSAWLNEDIILYTVNRPGETNDGEIRSRGLRTGADMKMVPAGAAEGYSCHHGHFVWWGRGDRLKSITVSASGHRAGTVDLGHDVILELDGVEIDRGRIVGPRFGGDALAWTKFAADGSPQTWGRRTPTSPNEPLWVRADGEFYPIPVETPGGLYLVNHGHADLYCRPWGEREEGWIAARGVTDYPDACWDAQDGGWLAFVWSARGEPGRASIALGTPWEDIGPNPAPPQPEPPPEPPMLPDTAFTPNPAGRITREQMRAFLRATATAVVERDGGRVWWLRKSTERDDWGEWWFERDGFLGVLEDRSTGLRDCPDGKRRSPETCVRDGYDYTTLPLASYYLRGANGYPWAVMETEGVWDSGPLRVDYVWSNGDVWPNIPYRAKLEPGAGVAGGYPVFARQIYDKRDGDEFNLWGESGWRRHDDTDNGHASVNRDPPPAFPRGPFVEPRRPRPYGPIFIAAPPPPPKPPTPKPEEPTPMPVNPSDEEIIALRERAVARAEAILGAPLDAAPGARHPNLADDLSALVDIGVKYMTFRERPGLRDHEIATRKVEALMHQWRRDGWLGGGDPGPLPEYPPLPPA